MVSVVMVVAVWSGCFESVVLVMSAPYMNDLLTIAVVFCGEQEGGSVGWFEFRYNACLLKFVRR